MNFVSTHKCQSLYTRIIRCAERVIKPKVGTNTIIVMLGISSPIIAGVWGAGSFDSDDALDVINHITRSDRKDSLHQYIDRSNWNVKTLEGYTALQMVTACEIVAAMIGRPSPALPDDVKQWVSRNKEYDVSDLVSYCKAGIEEMLLQSSPAKEMWFEEETYIEWTKTLRDVERRLDG